MISVKEVKLNPVSLRRADRYRRYLKSKKILKQTLNKSTGYYSICASIGGRNDKKCIKPHIAVACMFVSGKKDGLIVNHKDGNKTNNNFSNLEWCTQKENAAHASKNGLWEVLRKGIYND